MKPQRTQREITVIEPSYKEKGSVGRGAFRLNPISSFACETAFFDQRLHIRVAATECAVHCARIFRPTARKNHFAVTLTVGTCQSAMLGEPCVRIVIQHFAPHIRVIPGGISSLPDVRKVVGPVAWRNQRHRNVEAFERI